MVAELEEQRLPDDPSGLPDLPVVLSALGSRCRVYAADLPVNLV